jgi:hypothetical protein
VEVEAFISSVHKDLAHRKRELTRVKLSIQGLRGEEDADEWMNRAAAVLTYAHWEGFVKTASVKYLKFINGLNLPVQSLKICFHAAMVASHFKQAAGTQKTSHLAQLLTAMDGLRAEAFNVNPQKVIDTEHNLSSAVFLGMLAGIGLEPFPQFATRTGFIDATLVYGRNQVAHGELVSIAQEEAIERIDGVNELLDHYSNQLIDAVTQGSYMAA